MRVIAFLALLFGFTGLMFLHGQTFTHAIIGIICGIAAMGSGLACARKDYANGGRRWGGWGTAILGLGLAVYCVIQLPSAYRFQEKFNTRSKEYSGRAKANPTADFHALGFDDPAEAKTLFDTYKQVFTAQISEDYWEKTTPHEYSLHHFKASVTKSYKGGWKVGEKVSYLLGVDAPALTVSNAFVGSNMLLLTDEHVDREIIFGAGDFFLVDTNLERVLQLDFPESK
jgi:hypothetical protein